MKTPPSSSLKIKRKAVCYVRRRPLSSRVSNEENQGSGWNVRSTPRDSRHTGMPMVPSIIIQWQEMSAFFQILEDDLMQGFLTMDCCYKMSDKYLLAMTFVYFKRARFSLGEFTRKNFFIALYLANTMEEDEEETKYEIFPWALGRNWRKHFPRFLRQRDELWARIQYRAAVSRRCCEEVMAIASSHYLWQRRRSSHHSGAQRRYSSDSQILIPRGPSASPLTCALCSYIRTGHQRLASSSNNLESAHQQSLAAAIDLEITPLIAADPFMSAVDTDSQSQQSCCFCPAEVQTNVSPFESSSYESFFDWINEM